MPGLAVIRVGDDPASAVYVRNKERACAEIGVATETFHLPATTSEADVIALIDRLNADDRFHGILVQLPLPRHIDPHRVAFQLALEKDVDGAHPASMGRLARGEPGYVPVTPLGVKVLLQRSGIPVEGRHVVVCGRSTLVGRPAALLFMDKAAGANATVTVCHTGTRDLASITRQADILIAAMGRPSAITADMVRDGAVVVDVGINRVASPTTKSGFRLVGDVDFDAVRQKASAITPVPGGVGPMTVAMLLFQTVQAAKAAWGGAA